MIYLCKYNIPVLIALSKNHLTVHYFRRSVRVEGGWHVLSRKIVCCIFEEKTGLALKCIIKYIPRKELVIPSQLLHHQLFHTLYFFA